MPCEGPSDQIAAAAAVAAGGASNNPETPLGLLDMPALWLQHLPVLLGNNDVLPLLSCCRALRDLVLSQRRVLLNIRTPLLPDQAQAKLLLACKLASNVKLKLVNGEAGLHDYAALIRLMTGAMAAAGQALVAIKSVILERLDLDALVPSWLTTTCPNMTHLALLSCHASGLPAPTVISIPTCPQLKHLELGFFMHPPIDKSDQLKWQHQLRALTGLNSLTLSLTLSQEFAPGLFSCCSVIGSQLTRLSFPTWVVVEPALLQLADWMPHVYQLQLPRVVVDDRAMDLLLNLGSVRSLLCSTFRLQRSYSHRPCPWTHLGFTKLDVASFDLLPLAGVQDLTGAHVGTIIPSNDLAANERVAALVVRCGGLKFNSTVHLDNLRGLADSACLAAVMPMLSTYTSSGVLLLTKARPVTPDLIVSMSQNLPGILKLEIITMVDCTFSPAVLLLLLPSLAPVTCTLIIACGGLSEVQMTEMCVHTCLPVKVITVPDSDEWPAGWQQRVQAAMAGAGHQHVTFHP